MRNRLSKRRDRRVYKRTLLKKDVRNLKSTGRGGTVI